jgi:hypothetical protein
MSRDKSAFNMLQDTLAAIERRLFRRTDERAADKGAKLEERLAEAEARIAALEQRLTDKEK